MTEQERQLQAQNLLQLALQQMAQDYGVTIEPALQMESINGNYATTRAVLQLKAIPGWQPVSVNAKPIEQPDKH